MFDTDGSGTISCGEFRDVCLAVGMTPTDDELKVLESPHCPNSHNARSDCLSTLKKSVHAFFLQWRRIEA